MASAVALEPLRNAVLGLAAAIVVLALFLLVQRAVAWLLRSRANRRVPVLTRLVYEAVQSAPADASALARLA